MYHVERVLIDAACIRCKLFSILPLFSWWGRRCYLVLRRVSSMAEGRMPPQLQSGFPPGAAAVGGVGPQVRQVLLLLVCPGGTSSGCSGLGQQPRDDVKKLCKDTRMRIETTATTHTRHTIHIQKPSRKLPSQMTFTVVIMTSDTCIFHYFVTFL